MILFKNLRKIKSGKHRLLNYASMVGSAAVLVSVCLFSVQAVFLPLNPENTAAKKHKTAANTKAIVSAFMNGEEMALGKKV